MRDVVIKERSLLLYFNISLNILYTLFLSLQIYLFKFNREKG